jgi:ABC-type multidrug transport system ATPase subunit
MKIELPGVTKTYGKTRALDHVSIELAPGKIVALLGANGSGKTTLLRTLYGLVAPDKGAILCDNQEFSRDNILVRKRMFFMPDFPFVFGEMSPLQHIGMCLKIFEVQRPGIEATVVQLLKEFDLLPIADRPLQTFSRGQYYKTALCAMLAVDPEVWLLDEPLASGMDPHGLTAFKNHAQEAALRGRTILYSTQILDVAERFSDRICIIDSGEIKAFGTMAELESSKGARGLEAVFRSLRDAP